MPAIIPINNSDYNHYLRAALSIPLLANIQVLWIHLIITKPSDKYLHQRLPGPRCWIRVAPAILLGAIADHLTPLYVLELENYFINLADFFDGNDILDPAGNLAIRRGHKLGLMGLIPFFVTSMATLPARTMFIRIAASMLPDDDEPIVPLDPSLKTNPPMRLLDAWRSVADQTWARAWRLQARAYLLSVIIYFVGKLSYQDFHRFAMIPLIWFSTYS